MTFANLISAGRFRKVLCWSRGPFGGPILQIGLSMYAGHFSSSTVIVRNLGSLCLRNPQQFHHTTSRKCALMRPCPVAGAEQLPRRPGSPKTIARRAANRVRSQLRWQARRHSLRRVPEDLSAADAEPVGAGYREGWSRSASSRKDERSGAINQHYGGRR
jgi:hypothetical protein